MISPTLQSSPNTPCQRCILSYNTVSHAQFTARSFGASCLSDKHNIREHETDVEQCPLARRTSQSCSTTKSEVQQRRKEGEPTAGCCASCSSRSSRWKISKQAGLGENKWAAIDDDPSYASILLFGIADHGVLRVSDVFDFSNSAIAADNLCQQNTPDPSYDSVSDSLRFRNSRSAGIIW